MKDLVIAIGLVMVLEGALYALFPERMIEMAKQIQKVPPAALRAAGLLFVAIGWIVVRLVKG